MVILMIFGDISRCLEEISPILVYEGNDERIRKIERKKPDGYQSGRAATHVDDRVAWQITTVDTL